MPSHAKLGKNFFLFFNLICPVCPCWSIHSHKHWILPVLEGAYSHVSQEWVGVHSVRSHQRLVGPRLLLIVVQDSFRLCRRSVWKSEQTEWIADKADDKAWGHNDSGLFGATNSPLIFFHLPGFWNPGSWLSFVHEDVRLSFRLFLGCYCLSQESGPFISGDLHRESFSIELCAEMKGMVLTESDFHSNVTNLDFFSCSFFVSHCVFVLLWSSDVIHLKNQRLGIQGNNRRYSLLLDTFEIPSETDHENMVNLGLAGQGSRWLSSLVNQWRRSRQRRTCAQRACARPPGRCRGRPGTETCCTDCTRRGSPTRLRNTMFIITVLKRTEKASGEKEIWPRRGLCFANKPKILYFLSGFSNQQSDPFS